MKDLFIVSNFTIREMIKRKSFLISMLLILAIIVIAIGVYASSYNDGKDANYYGKILMYDEANIFQGRLTEFENDVTKYEIAVSEEPITNEMINQQISEQKITAGMIITEVDGKLNLEYLVNSNSGYITTAPIELINLMNNAYKEIKLKNLGVAQTTIDVMNSEPAINIREIGEETQVKNTFVIMVATIILFYAIYFCAFQVSTAITTEKTSRIVETLVTSTKPSIIILGKTIGIGIVGVFQIIAIVATVVGSAYTFLEPEMINGLVDLSTITPVLAIYIIVYFILGYLFYALLYALVGATISKQEEVNAANTPVSIISVLGFYLAYFSMLDPTGEMNGFAAVCPISSAFCMPFRIMTGLAAKSEILFSLIALVFCIVVIARISIRVYSLAILNYGNKLKIKDIIKMYRDK